MGKRRNIVEQEAEEYFIQFWFCENKQMLLRELREVYDEAFKTYLRVYREGRKQGIDLGDINKKFKLELCQPTNK
jgi:hypothetical protein